MAKRPCGSCGELRSVSPTSRAIPTCQKCRAARRPAPAPRKPSRARPDCIGCGERITRHFGGRGKDSRLFCSRACSDQMPRVWHLSCPLVAYQCSTCGVAQVGRKARSRCKACRTAKPVRTCLDCGAALTTRNRRCDECRAAARLAARRASRAKAYDGGNKDPNARARRKCRQTGASYEPIKSSHVFERDGWVCGICHEDIDPSSRYPDLMSASLDHVVPLANGGSHTYGNVQAAHFLCNSYKRHDQGFDLRLSA